MIKWILAVDSSFLNVTENSDPIEMTKRVKSKE